MLSVSTSPPTYRAYVIGVGGRIMDVYELACDTDERAIQAARAYVDGRAIELWDRERRIAVLPPLEPTDQPADQGGG
jgi:hypothetical protein